MKTAHTKALDTFARRLLLLLMVRGAVQWATVWFFVWGVVVLAARIAVGARGDWLLWGVLGFTPLALVAALRAERRKPTFVSVRANYDRLRGCGGVIMAEEADDTSAWQERLAGAAMPVLRWRGGRMVGVLGVSVLFVAVALLLPERMTAFATRKPLEVSSIVSELKAEVQTLQEEKILEDKKAEDLQTQLAALQKDSSGMDPNKTWEALDHIKEANSDAARQAAEEALNKMTSLTQAETLAAAMEKAADTGGLDSATATRAAQDLSSMLKAAKLEEGLLKGEIPPELMSGLDGLNKEDMEKLMKSMAFNKDKLGKTMGKLANGKLISAAALAKAKAAGAKVNPDALAAFLSESAKDCDSIAAVACMYGKGGVNRGPGAAPMTWKEESSAEGAKFKEEALPPSSQLSDAQLVGVSRAAPQLSDEDVAAEHGALAGAASSGGSAHAQVVLPEHKEAVRRFFKRTE